MPPPRSRLVTSPVSLALRHGPGRGAARPRPTAGAPGDGRRYDTAQRKSTRPSSSGRQAPCALLCLCAAAEAASAACSIASLCQRAVSATTVRVFSHAARRACMGRVTSLSLVRSEPADVDVLRRWCVRGSSIFLGFRRVLDECCCRHAPACGLHEPPSKTAGQASSEQASDLMNKAKLSYSK